MSDNDIDIEALLDYLDAQCLPGYRKALTALVAERNELKAQVSAHAEDRRRYIDSWAWWIDHNAKLDIAEWLRFYADAVPHPPLDGDTAKQRVFDRLDQRMRDAAERIDADSKRIAELESQPPAASNLRERLVESALRGAGTGAARSVRSSMLTEAEAEALGRQAVWMADGAFDEMRKGDANG